METNDLANTSPTLIWETVKAVLRGKIISYSTYIKKKEHEEENKLEEIIKQLHSFHAAKPTEETLKEIRKAKFQHDNIINKKTQFMLETAIQLF